jgi:hypothetical protein
MSHLAMYIRYTSIMEGFWGEVGDLEGIALLLSLLGTCF